LKQAMSKEELESIYAFSNPMLGQFYTATITTIIMKCMCGQTLNLLTCYKCPVCGIDWHEY